MMAEPGDLRRIVRMIYQTRADEISCDECFAQLDRFAELVREGQPAAKVLPLVQAHLDRCDDCREEFEALLAALRGLS